LRTAREALILIGAPARERLIYILGVGHVHRRQDAAFVLGEMGDPDAVKPLCTALHNPDGLLRLLCVEALGKIGDPAAVPMLKKALRDPESRVARAAQKALAGIEARPR
jgi:HEAT repeat protein